MRVGDGTVNRIGTGKLESVTFHETRKHGVEYAVNAHGLILCEFAYEVEERFDAEDEGTHEVEALLREAATSRPALFGVFDRGAR